MTKMSYQQCHPLETGDCSDNGSQSFVHDPLNIISDEELLFLRFS